MNPGDKIEFTIEKNGKTSVEIGTLLPRAEIFDQDIHVVKLENGYNVGINKSTIKSSKVLEKHKKLSQSLPKSKPNPKLPTIAFLSTGGTISSRIDYTTGGVVADYGAEEFKALMPELDQIANINAKKIGAYMSEDVTFNQMSQIAKDVEPYLKDKNIKGIVLTSGTDTMHFIAAGLSFMFSKLNKPIIITGSQRSIDRGSTDAFENIICSVIAATKWNAGEVAICMHETTNDGACILSRGTKVRKMHTSRRDAFRPINEQPIAKVTPGGEFTILNKKFNTPESQFEIKPDLEEKTGMVTIHPNIDPKIIDFYVQNKYKGLVISGTAFGHVPQNIISPLQKAKDAGMLIIVASQTIYGGVHPYVYTNLRKLSLGIGLLFVKDMLADTAFMKLAWVLANSKSSDEARDLMSQNLKNEFAGEIDEVSFLR